MQPNWGCAAHLRPRHHLRFSVPQGGMLALVPIEDIGAPGAMSATLERYATVFAATEQGMVPGETSRDELRLAPHPIAVPA